MYILISTIVTLMRDRAGNVSVRFLLLCINKCLSLEHRRLYVWGAAAPWCLWHNLWPWCGADVWSGYFQPSFNASASCAFFSPATCAAQIEAEPNVFFCGWLLISLPVFLAGLFFVSSVLKDTQTRERDTSAFQISIYSGNPFLFTPDSIHQLTASCRQPLP